jgi:DNA mismatch repair ATPase MutS
MFSLKLNQLFASLKDAKDLARKFNRPRHSDADPRELHRMRAELRAAQEHARLMNVFHRNRIF